MGIFVQDFHLLASVKRVPPVGHHLLQVAGGEAVAEGSPFQLRCVAGLLQAAMQVLRTGALARLARCLHVPYAKAGMNRLSWLHRLLCLSLGHHKPSWSSAILCITSWIIYMENIFFYRLAVPLGHPGVVGSTLALLLTRFRVLGTRNLPALPAERRISSSACATDC